MSEIQPIEEKTIELNGEILAAVLVEESDGRENVYVALRPLVQSLGLNWSGQSQRVKRDPILSQVSRTLSLSFSGQRRATTCLPLSYVNGFLFGINADLVNSSLRPLLIAYQKEAYQILFQAFRTTDSMRRFYAAQGRDEPWIESRVQKHLTGTDLKHEWLARGVDISDHGRLQDRINKGTFGVDIGEHRQMKQLPDDQDLEDHFTRAELIFSMLGDEATQREIDSRDAQGLEENEQAAEEGGQIAGELRVQFESRTGQPVLSGHNFLAKRLAEEEEE